MEIDKFLVGILLFGVMVFIGLLMIGDVNINYAAFGANISNDSFSKVNYQVNLLYNDSQIMRNKVLGNQSGIEDSSNVADSLFKGAYSALVLVDHSFGIVLGVLEAVLAELSIPYAETFAVFIMGILTIMIIFALIYLIFRVI